MYFASYSKKYCGAQTLVEFATCGTFKSHVCLKSQKANIDKLKVEGTYRAILSDLRA